ncbi:MAG: putative bifunctional diguanylate cyclase/phosphodiesterase [Pseudonocardiaceae bacterium]
MTTHADCGPGRADLARQWAKALRATAYVPTSPDEIEHLLRELIDMLFDTLTAEEFSPNSGRAVGQQLVAAYFTGEQSLSRTVEVLGPGLPADPALRGVDGLAGKVTSLLGAVAAGYATALRAKTLEQQEEVKQALLKATLDAERGLRISEAKLRQLFTSSAVGIAISDLDGTLLEVNQALGKILGSPPTELAGRRLYELFHPHDVASLRTAYQQLANGKRASSRLPQRFRLIDEDGEPAWTYLAVSLLYESDGKPTHQVTIMEDVTELHLLGQQLRHQSLHDALTGLPNQQFFVSTLEGALGRAGADSLITVFKIDLNGLAVINDGFGREIGDQVLQSIAGRLQSAVAGEQATVARFGSDEFAILIENSSTTPGVTDLAAHVNSTLVEPVLIEGCELAVSGCVGIVEHRGSGMAPAALLRAAEAALHDVKSRGQRQWGLFDPRSDTDHRRQCRLAAAMPGAWTNGEIRLDYEPLVRLADGSVVGIQALLHWDEPRTGPLPHQDCRELAARTGLLIPLGQWMLRSACAQLASWQQRFGRSTPLLHVDLTPQQSHDPALVRDVRNALALHELAAEHLQLGIPVAALDAEPGEDNLRVLAEMGVAITLLGINGVADLAHLEDLPARTVEIAPRVVQRVVPRPGALCQDSDNSTVAQAVPHMLHLMHCCGATVIVRGINTRNDADWWKSAGADVGQGAFVAPPADPDKIVTLFGSP